MILFLPRIYKQFYKLTIKIRNKKQDINKKFTKKIR